MLSVEGAGLLHSVLRTLEFKDLARTAQVRQAWRSVAEELLAGVCLAEFPSTRWIRASCKKSWQQLYSEAIILRRPPRDEGRLDGERKCAVDVFVGTCGSKTKRLIHTNVYNVNKEADAGFMDELVDGYVAREHIELAEPLEITPELVFCIDITFFCAKDGTVCSSYCGVLEWIDGEDAFHEGSVDEVGCSLHHNTRDGVEYHRKTKTHFNVCSDIAEGFTHFKFFYDKHHDRDDIWTNVVLDWPSDRDEFLNYYENPAIWPVPLSRLRKPFTVSHLELHVNAPRSYTGGVNENDWVIIDDRSFSEKCSFLKIPCK